MNRKLETLVQELALAAINNNFERAERLIKQCPQDVVEKVALGADRLTKLAIRHLPVSAGLQIQQSIEEKEKATAVGN